MREKKPNGNSRSFVGFRDQTWENEGTSLNCFNINEVLVVFKVSGLSDGSFWFRCQSFSTGFSAKWILKNNPS